MINIILTKLGAVHKLLSILQELRREEELLRTVMEVQRKYTAKDLSISQVVPQIMSTLPCSVIFKPPIFVQPYLKISVIRKRKVPSFSLLGLLAKKDRSEIQQIGYKSLLKQLSAQKIPLVFESKIVKKLTYLDISQICTWLISAPPGMGKSILTQRLATFLRIAFPKFKIVKANFNDVRSYFLNRRTEDISAQSFLEFLEIDAKCDQKISFILDGFDEICPEQKDKTLKLVRNIAEKFPLLISTRPHEVRGITSALKEIPFASVGIEPFDTSKQRELISQLNFPMSETDCLAYFEKIEKSGVADLMEIPLHLTMITQLVDKNDSKIVANKSELYEKLVRRKIRSSLDVQENKKDEKVESVMLLLAKTATLFAKNKPISGLNDSEITDLNRTGLVTIDDSSVKFAHQTFVEFFLAFHTLKKTSDTFEGEIKFSKLFNNQNETHTQALHFIDTFCSDSSILTKDIISYFHKINSKKCLDLLMLFCEGFPNFFDAFLSNSKLSKVFIKKVINDNVLELLKKASKCNEQVALKVLEITDNVQILFGDSKVEYLDEIVYSVVENNYIELFKQLNFLHPNKKMLEKFTGKFSRKWYLKKAVERNNLEMVKLLIEAGADCKVTDDNGWNALHFAAIGNNFEIGKLLFEAENSLLIEKDEWGESALYFAMKYYNIEFEDHLIGKGTNPRGKDKSGRTALHWATFDGATKVVQFLIESGADLEIRDKGGRTALHFDHGGGNLECVKLLVEAKPSLLKAKNDDNESVLLCASKHSELDVVKYFVEKGLNPRDRDKKGRNALHWAAQRQRVEIAKYLLEISRDLIDEVDNEGNSALHIAAGRGDLEMVKFLCNEFGSRLISLKNKANKTPIDVKWDECLEFMRNFQEAHPN